MGIDARIFECALVDDTDLAHITGASAGRTPRLNQRDPTPLRLKRRRHHAIAPADVTKRRAWRPLLSEGGNQCIAMLKPKTPVLNLSVNAALINGIRYAFLDVFPDR